MKARQQSKTDSNKTSAKLLSVKSGKLSSTALASSQFKNTRNLSLSCVDNNPNQDAQAEMDIPKNDGVDIAAVLDFFPKAALYASAASVTTLTTLLLLSCNREISIAIGSGTGVLTLFGLCKYKSAQASARINEIKSQPEERIERVGWWGSIS